MKNKKHTIMIVILLAVSAILWSCEPAPSDDIDVNVDIDLELLASVLMEDSELELSDMIPASEAKIQNEYGFSDEEAIEVIMLVAPDVLSRESILLVKSTGGDAAASIAEKIENSRQYALNELADYTISPDYARQYLLVEQAKIKTSGDYIFFIVNENELKIGEKIDDYISQAANITANNE